MISQRFQANIKSWQAFMQLSKQQQKVFLSNLSLSQVKDMEELFYNILKGNAPVASATLERLRKHKRKCKLLAHRKLSLSKKRKLLQSGDGLPLLTLGLSLLPALIELIRK